MLLTRRVRGGRALLRAAAVIFVLSAVAPALAAGSTISGTAFTDINRDSVQQLGEAPLVDQRIYAISATGVTAGVARTDAAGRYVLTGLADGNYSVDYDYTDWSALVTDWVPTTTGGSLAPRHQVALNGSAQADFGWRPIVRSATIGSPITAVTAPSGLKVESYVDAVTAGEVLQVAGRLLIGAEAPWITIRFGYGTGGGMTTASYGQANGIYTDYNARVWVPYVSWAMRGDATLAHEYGHAWNGYFATMVQQDDTRAAYVRARGLEGDPRLNSSYAWSVDEMFAEDYRELFGSVVAQADSQINREIPLAVDVPGLKDFMLNTYRQSPAGSPPPPTPVPALVLGAVAVSPTPVTRSGTVSWSLSESASTTVTISRGTTAVRTLLFSASRPAGASSVVWDRKDSAGRKVAAGTYLATVTATAADGRTATQSLSFSVK